MKINDGGFFASRAVVPSCYDTAQMTPNPQNALLLLKEISSPTKAFRSCDPATLLFCVFIFMENCALLINVFYVV